MKMGLIQMRVNLEEKEIFEKEAELNGVTLSYWIRESCLIRIAGVNEEPERKIDRLKEIVKSVEKKYEEPKVEGISVINDPSKITRVTFTSLERDRGEWRDPI